MSSTDCSRGPTPNPDVSGIGVRLSFYIQAVLLAVLSARTSSADEITQNLGTLIVTNMAYAVTTLVLGFTNQPNQLNLYDALVVLYLLTPSWAAIFFTMPQYNRHKRSGSIIKYLAILQSYLIFACAFAVLRYAPTFGTEVECNKDLVFVIFKPFKVLYAGRNAFLVLLAIVTLAYTVLLYLDYSSLIHPYFKERKYKRIPGQMIGMMRKICVALRIPGIRPLPEKEDTEKQDKNAEDNSAKPRKTGQGKSGKGARSRRSASTSIPRTSPSSTAASDTHGPATSGVSSPAPANNQQQPPAQSGSSDHASPSPPPFTQDMNRQIVSFAPPPSTSPPTSSFTSTGSTGREEPLFTLPMFGGAPFGMSKAQMNVSFDTSYRANINGRLLVNLILILVTSMLAILNTELLRHLNHPNDSAASEGSWGFGQILPLFLTVLPAWSTFLAFRKHGLGEKKKEGRRVRVKAAGRRPQVRRQASSRASNNPFGGGGGATDIFGFPTGPHSPGATTADDGRVTQFWSGATIEEVNDEEEWEKSSGEEGMAGPSRSAV
ncbi:hypothetical protein OE88DRAFT_896385 [Heliocybe sulcata]|uniref:Uncharacterized protein n=1 Tax=Heliocybe sulcata TaxID=5364 RepID=A0A5C3MP29_9AGAM|nr:hypothetical protein OE88DRAFT_896385 [Heliocybe sulcata]